MYCDLRSQWFLLGVVVGPMLRQFQWIQEILTPPVYKIHSVCIQAVAPSLKSALLRRIPPVSQLFSEERCQVSLYVISSC